jgi:hypothetical protein
MDDTMNLSETEQLVLAYFLAHGAQEFAMVGRFFPYGELTLLIQDKIQVAVRKFGRKAGMAAPAAARAFLDQLIERGAFSTTKDKFGASMHQYQPDAYKAALKALRAETPVLKQAEAAGPDFWEKAFAA